MINTGKCPKCESTLSNVKLQGMPVNEGFQERWHGVSYLCPHCDTILGVSIDPIAIKTDIVKEILRGLGKE